MKTDYLYFDYETYSPADLPTVGAYAYATDPGTAVLCLAAIYKSEKLLIYPINGDVCPGKWVKYFRDPNITKVAHNVQFDRLIYENVFPREKLVNYADSMASCYYYGYPGGLEKATAMMGIEGKFAEGRRAMLELCRLPRAEVTDFTRKLDLCGNYCIGDVVMLKRLYTKLGPLETDFENDLFKLTASMNDFGIRMDLKNAKMFIMRFQRYLIEADHDIKVMTGGEVQLSDLARHKFFKDFMISKGLDLPNTQKATIDEALKRDDLSPEVKKILKFRRLIGQASINKIAKIVAMADKGGIVRGNLQYHGSHTGRWSGRGVQPQNLPRDSFSPKDFTAFVSNCKKDFNLENVEKLPKAIRPLIIPRPGKCFIVMDYAQIEAKVLAWIAGQSELVNQFIEGADVYQNFADASKVTRPVGKVAILGLGFGMGADKFRMQLKTMTGTDISALMASKIVSGYRLKYARIKNLWSVVEAVFRSVAIDKKKRNIKSDSAGISLKLSWSKKVNGVAIQLPSGRSMYYPETKATIDGIEYKGERTGKVLTVHLYGGILVENIIQAVARDIMAYCLLAMKNFNPVLTVHDEIIFEVDKKVSPGKLEALIYVNGIPDYFPRELVKLDMAKVNRYGKI